MTNIFVRTSRVLVDLAVISAAYFAAFFLRFEFAPDLQTYKLLFFTWPYVLILKYALLLMFGIPRFAWRYIGLREARAILLPLGIATGLLVALRLGLAFVGGYGQFVMIPLGVLAVDFFLSYLGITGIRVLRRIHAERREARSRIKPEKAPLPTMLVGAGRAGVLVAKELTTRPDLGIKAVGFLDDDERKHGTVVQGIRVLGPTSRCRELCAKHGAQQALITIANAPGRDIRRITESCAHAGVPAKIIPGIYEIVGGRVNLTRIRNVAIEDLLGRAQVTFDSQTISNFIACKVVLVTGAGGSIGSEICRQVAAFGPARLILLERFENGLFEIHSELKTSYPEAVLLPRIADITDERRIDQIFDQGRPDVVFHAAAHKHVPMMEWNPGEAIKNNIGGTRLLARCADVYGVGSFVLISTDKAVNPASVMGASKRVAELFIQGMAARSKTRFAAVRFGNVLGSSGSVIPVFKKQIAAGGPVTVTHPEMRRYFMTIPEATHLVLEAAAMGQGGEVFILDMGEPVRIIDLARDLIRLSGFDPDRDIEIRITGIRPGEKLFEELSTDEERAEKTRHAQIFIGRVKPADWSTLGSGIEELLRTTDDLDERQVYRALRGLIPEFSGSYSAPAVSTSKAAPVA